MNIIHVSLCLIIIAILMHFIRKHKNKRFYQLLEQFPSHPTYPLIGNAHVLFGSLEGLLQRLETLLQPYNRQVFWLGPTPCIMLKNHGDIAVIQNQCQDRNTLDLVDAWLNTGIINAGYEEWKKSKKMLAPRFTSDILLKYYEVFRRNAQNLVEMWKPVADTGEQIDVFHWLTITNLEIIAENALGVSIRESGNLGEAFCHSMLEGFEHGVKRLRWPILLSRYVNAIYLKITGKSKVIDHLKYLPTKVLKEKLSNYHAEQGQSSTAKGDNDSFETIIDFVIRNSSKEDSFTEARIITELLQIIVAGVETSALTISFLMLMLAMHQDIQQTVYEEIIQLIPNDEALSQSHLINHLEYLEQCIKETLRMFGPVAVTTRQTHKEILLSDNTIVPKDILVIAFLHFANYDADLYKNPQIWNPENFSKEAMKQRSKTSQLSFGYGPRSCIGVRYAMLSVKTQIAYILRNYYLSTNVKEFTKHHLMVDLGIKSKIGYPITFTTRQQK